MKFSDFLWTHFVINYFSISFWTSQDKEKGKVRFKNTEPDPEPKLNLKPDLEKKIYIFFWIHNFPAPACRRKSYGLPWWCRSAPSSASSPAPGQPVHSSAPDQARMGTIYQICLEYQKNIPVLTSSEKNVKRWREPCEHVKEKEEKG